MITASRSHRLMVRVQNIESSLPPLEKAVLAQTSHIHFAYTSGMIFLGSDLILHYSGFTRIIMYVDAKYHISSLHVIALRS